MYTDYSSYNTNNLSCSLSKPTVTYHTMTAQLFGMIMYVIVASDSGMCSATIICHQTGCQWQTGHAIQLNYHLLAILNIFYCMHIWCIQSHHVTLDLFFIYFHMREREIKFIGLFKDRGHRGLYSPYKSFNHNLYIGIIIFPHIDDPQSTGHN